jgi:restriction system protein
LLANKSHFLERLANIYSHHSFDIRAMALVFSLSKKSKQMSNEIPKFHETFNPILEVLSHGNMMHSRDLQQAVIEKHYAHLSPEQLSQTISSGDNLLQDRINWGKAHLKKGGFVHYPQRGHVQITPRGLAQSEFLSLAKLKTFYENTQNEPALVSEVETEILNASPQDLIDAGIQQMAQELKLELLERLKTMNPYGFEKVVLLLLKKMGYGEFTETSKSRDGGIDGIINQDQLGLDKIYIQSKRFAENKVRELDIRNFIGAMSGDTHKGIFVTTSQFHTDAIEKAKSARHKIILIDGQKLVALMHQFNVGVQNKEVYEVKHLDEDFFDLV